MVLFAKSLCLAIVVTFGSFSGCFVNRDAYSTEERLIVVGIADGDTLTIRREKDGQMATEKIRLATIDAPEYKQAFGVKSRKSLADLVHNRVITLRTMGHDRYGRTIGEIFYNGKNINVEQIRRGYAWHYKQHADQQSFEEKLIYEKAEEYARENNLGLWDDKTPVAPWLYRKDHPRFATMTPQTKTK